MLCTSSIFRETILTAEHATGSGLVPALDPATLLPYSRRRLPQEGRHRSTGVHGFTLDHVARGRGAYRPPLVHRAQARPQRCARPTRTGCRPLDPYDRWRRRLSRASQASSGNFAASLARWIVATWTYRASEQPPPTSSSCFDRATRPKNDAPPVSAGRATRSQDRGSNQRKVREK